MRTRRELTHQVVLRYRKAARKEKSLILSEFVSSSGYNRSSAATLLRPSALLLMQRKISVAKPFIRTESKEVALAAPLIAG